MKLVYKMSFGFIVSIILIWITVIFALNTYTLIHEEFSLVEEDVVPGLIMMVEMESRIHEVKARTLDYILYGNVISRNKTEKELLLESMVILENAAVEHTRVCACTYAE